MSLKNRITEEMKSAMRAKNSAALSVIRMLQAAIKQVEVDERIEADDERILTILSKMLKQRQESERIYREANRADLADKEAFEIGFLQAYLPAQMSEEEILNVVQAAVKENGASGMAQMGKVMATLKPKLTGVADMAIVSQILKKVLQNS